MIAAAAAVAAWDGYLAVTVCSAFNRGCTVGRAFRGIASYAPSFIPGSGTAVLGVFIHCTVAAGWTTLYWVAYSRWLPLRRLTAGWAGTAAASLLLGVLVWLAMDLVVLPTVGGGRHTPITSPAFWVVLAGHPLVVGLPIVALIRQPLPEEP